MAIVVIIDNPGMSEADYEAVAQAVNPEGLAPSGGMMHAAGPIEGGWRVVELWESREGWERWRNETLIPVVQRMGRAQPLTQVMDVHQLIGPFQQHDLQAL